MKKNILLFLVITLIFPISVNAVTGDVKIKCDKTTVSPGDIVECTISGENFKEEISQFQTNVKLGDELELVSATKDSSWEGSAEKGDIDLYTDKNKIGSLKFATMKFKVLNTPIKKNTQIILDNIVIGDSQFIETSLNNVTLDISIILNDANFDNEDQTTVDNQNGNESTETEENNAQKQENNSSIKILIIVSLTIILLILTILLIYSKVINRNKNNGGKENER